MRNPVLPTHKKLQKLFKKSEKWKKMGSQTCFCQWITWFLVFLVKFIESVVIGAIDWLSGTIICIGVVPDTFLVTNSKVSIGDPMTSVTDSKVSIESYCHRLPSVTECSRLRNSHNIFPVNFVALKLSLGYLVQRPTLFENPVGGSERFLPNSWGVIAFLLTSFSKILEGGLGLVKLG